MWLAAHLYSEGKISGDQFASACVEQICRRKPLGAIALQHDMLTMKQVMRILGEQSTVSGLPFGEVAIRLKLLTSDQVAQLLHFQTANVPTVEEIIVELGWLTEEEVSCARQSKRTVHARASMATPAI